MNYELSCDGKMDEQCSTSNEQCFDVYSNSQDFCVLEVPKTFSSKENNSDYVCNLCNKYFASELNLSNHIKIHVARKPHVCKICCKSFKEKRYLKGHLVTHSGGKPHVCKICNKSYTQNSSLNKHLLLHSGKKSHVCDICDKAFTLKSILKSHLLTHSGEKSHVCNICNKAFARKAILHRHSLIHSGKKSLVCNTCDKSFTFKSAFKQHLLTHFPKKSYACEICRKSFVRECYLNRHLKTSHGGKNDVDSSLDRRQELPSTSCKSESKHLEKLEVNKEIVYIIEEDHGITDEKKWDLDVGEMLTKSDVDSQEMSCDVKEENTHDEMNDIVKEEHIDHEEIV